MVSFVSEVLKIWKSEKQRIKLHLPKAGKLGERKILAKGFKFSIIRGINSGNLTESTLTIINNTVL